MPEHLSSSVYYFLENELVNQYPYWTNSANGQAIWFDGNGSTWLVGVTKNVGTNIGGILGPSGKDDWPHEIRDGWRYVRTSYGTSETIWTIAESFKINFKADPDPGFDFIS